MLRLATESGTGAIVATPHFSTTYSFDYSAVYRSWEKVQYLAGPQIRIYRGSEVELKPEMIRKVLEQPARYTINGYQYLLVDLPEEPVGRVAEELIAELQRAGLQVILAHPELHLGLAQDFGRLRRWVERGVLVHASAGSLTGRFGRFAERNVRRILHYGLAHLIASNGHDVQGRPPRLDEARLRLKLDYPPDYAELLFEQNPQAVLNGEPVAAGPVRAPYLRRHWFQVWR